MIPSDHLQIFNRLYASNKGEQKQETSLRVNTGNSQRFWFLQEPPDGVLKTVFQNIILNHYRFLLRHLR